MRAKTILFRCASVAVGVAAGLLVCELGLRWVGYAGDEERLNRVFVPAFGAVRKDSWVVDFRLDPARQSEVSIRGQRFPIQKPAGETRILFLGDSGTEGAHVSLSDTYPLQFQKLLDRKHPGNRVRVINAGVWGMTTIDEFHFLKEELILLEPDAVVVGLFMANDINFNLGHSQSRVQHRPRSKAVAHLEDRSALVHFLYLKALALNDRYKWINTATLAETRLIPVEFGLFDAYGFHMLSYPAGEVATYMKKPSALVDRAFNVLRAIFGQFKALSSAQGFVFRVVLIPTPSAVAQRLTILHHPNILQELRVQGIEVRESDLDFALPTRRVLAICKDLDIECFDPTRRMKQIGLSVFFEGDEHLTPIGHRAVAQELIGD